MGARFGRLGTVLGHSQNAGLRGAAGRLFEAAVPATFYVHQPARVGIQHSGNASLS